MKNFKPVIVQVQGKTVKECQSMAEAQVYTNISRTTLKRMLNNGRAVNGFTVDLKKEEYDD